MLCDDCHKNQANIHLRRKTDTKIVSLALCQECAKKRGLGHELKSELEKLTLNMNAQLMSNDIENTGKDAKNDGNIKLKECGNKSTTPICDICKTTLAQFSKTGRFGCPSCYAAFAEALPPIIAAIHRGHKHRGRTPMSAKTDKPAAVEDNVAKIEELREELERAVATENYEHAAIIRDKIAGMKLS